MITFCPSFIHASAFSKTSRLKLRDQFLDRFFKNPAFKIEIRGWVGGYWASPEVYLFINFFEKLVHNAEGMSGAYSVLP